MMSTHLKSLLVSISAILFLASCASTNELTIGVTRPAPVFLSNDIQHVGIVNRSLPSDKNRTLDEIDKILTAEGKNLDKEGAQHALHGLKEKLATAERFESVKLLENISLRSPGMGVHPAALSWETVSEICDANGLDALMTLSFYDTDSSVKYSNSPVTIKGPLGTEIPGIEHRARVSTLIKTGWRIYDPARKIIADEYVEFNTAVSEGRGINPIRAVETIANRKEAVLQISQNLGIHYATRLFPYRTRVRRDYFVRGTDNFKRAMRLARTGYWNRAAELWESELNHSNDKIAGRAAYNMAIINEINGDLEAAIEWASRSYSEYRVRRGWDYVNILEGRIRSEQVLQRQLDDQTRKISLDVIEDQED